MRDFFAHCPCELGYVLARFKKKRNHEYLDHLLKRRQAESFMNDVMFKMDIEKFCILVADVKN